MITYTINLTQIRSRHKPRSWFSVVVVSDNGERTVPGFSTEEQAREWIEVHKTLEALTPAFEEP